VTQGESEYWDSVGREWARDRPQRLWREHSDAVNRALVDRWLPAGPCRVLKTDAFDEAFGGGIAGFLDPRGACTWVVDLSVTVIEEARARNTGLRGVGADVRSLPFQAQCFDAAVSLSTLDHFDSLEDLERALAELRRVLRPKGRLLITMDNPGNPALALRARLPYPWLHRIGLVPYYVGVTVDRRRLGEMLDRAGFAVAEVRATQHVPRAPAIALAALLSRVGGRRARRAFLRVAAGLEAMERLPTRFLTGYFVAARAIRR
jgi:SAM-dependent methyltransferase